jgi:hypothetical protein
MTESPRVSGSVTLARTLVGATKVGSPKPIRVGLDEAVMGIPDAAGLLPARQRRHPAFPETR